MFHRRRSRVTACLLAGVAASLLVSTAYAATNGTDNAGNYTSFSTTSVNPSNGGTGFGAWNLSNNNNNGSSTFSGYFLGDSTAGAGNINSSNGNSFAIYANPNGAYAVASRSFDSALNIGQIFSIQLSAAYTNGGKGINLLNSSGAQIFNFNVGDGNSNGSSYSYSYKDISGTTVPITTFSYHSDAVFSLSFSQTAAGTGAVTVVETSASAGTSVSFTDSSVSTTNLLASFQLYNSNTDNGSAQNNLYFNNLSVAVPEPSTVFAGLALVCSGAFVLGRRGRTSKSAAI